jgi:hypothetical protein
LTHSHSTTNRSSTLSKRQVAYCPSGLGPYLHHSREGSEQHSLAPVPTQDATVFNSRCSGVRTCAVLQKTSIIFSFCAMCTGLSHLRHSHSDAIQHRVLFVVLCIHICAVLEKDPSKFHISLELSRVPLGHDADVKAQHDNEKRTPLLSWVARWVCRLCSQSFSDRYRSTGQI